MRRSPLKRSPPIRSRRRTLYRQRPRFVDYMLFVKTLPCCAAFVNPQLSSCDGLVEADHAGIRGMSQKAHDSTVIPLCTKHHRERTAFAGLFSSWSQGDMRVWLASKIINTQRVAIARGVSIPALEEQAIR